ASELLHNKGRNDEARRMCEQSIAFGKARVLEHPRDVEMRMYLAGLEGQLSWSERVQGRWLAALKIRRSAAESLGALARENPLLIQVRSNLSLQLENLSGLQTDLGRYAEAEQTARAGIAVN